MNNFKSAVPQGIQLKMKELAKFIKENFRDIRSGHGESQSGECRLDEIEGNYKSGWMPRQDGGYDINEWMVSDMDSSHHFTEKQTEYMNRQQKDCWSAFIHDEDLPIDFTYNDLSEEEKEKLCEYENEWYGGGALLQCQLFVEGYADKIFNLKLITIRVSINYKDEYGRDKHAEDIKVIVLPVDEFMTTEIAAIIEQIKF